MFFKKFFKKKYNWRERITTQISCKEIEPKSGMKVICLAPADGDETTINKKAEVYYDNKIIGLIFDCIIDKGHDLAGHCKIGYGRYISFKQWNDGDLKIISK